MESTCADRIDNRDDSIGASPPLKEHIVRVLLTKLHQDEIKILGMIKKTDQIMEFFRLVHNVKVV